MDWSRYMRRVLAYSLVLGALLYGFILALDPYQNVTFSPVLGRQPVASNQRFAYPAIARDRRFDSAVIGTSTSRLIDPRALSAATDATFANLAMNSATAYEQIRMHELFVRHHPHMRHLVLGVDETWCARGQTGERYTFRAFPEWMYDENRWNDLIFLFNDKALEDAVRMLELVRGVREPKYRPDGYRDFTADFPPYDPAAAKRRLHGRAAKPVAPAAVLPALDHPQWLMPGLDELARVLAATPASTRVVILFPPLHSRYIARRAELFAECKGRVLARFSGRTETRFLDYLHVSELTDTDSNYWDPVHFTREVSAVIEQDLAALLRGRPVQSVHGRVLTPNQAAQSKP